jgi:hypothetical protein
VSSHSRPRAWTGSASKKQDLQSRFASPASSLRHSRRPATRSSSRPAQVFTLPSSPPRPAKIRQRNRQRHEKPILRPHATNPRRRPDPRPRIRSRVNSIAASDTVCRLGRVVVSRPEARAAGLEDAEPAEVADGLQIREFVLASERKKKEQDRGDKGCEVKGQLAQELP